MTERKLWKGRRTAGLLPPNPATHHRVPLSRCHSLPFWAVAGRPCVVTVCPECRTQNAVLHGVRGRPKKQSTPLRFQHVNTEAGSVSSWGWRCFSPATVSFPGNTGVLRKKHRVGSWGGLLLHSSCPTLTGRGQGAVPFCCPFVGCRPFLRQWLSHHHCFDRPLG